MLKPALLSLNKVENPHNGSNIQENHFHNHYYQLLFNFYCTTDRAPPPSSHEVRDEPGAHDHQAVEVDVGLARGLGPDGDAVAEVARRHQAERGRRAERSHALQRCRMAESIRKHAQWVRFLVVVEIWIIRVEGSGEGSKGEANPVAPMWLGQIG